MKSSNFSTKAKKAIFASVFAVFVFCITVVGVVGFSVPDFVDTKTSEYIAAAADDTPTPVKSGSFYSLYASDETLSYSGQAKNTAYYVDLATENDWAEKLSKNFSMELSYESKTALSLGSPSFYMAAPLRTGLKQDTNSDADASSVPAGAITDSIVLKSDGGESAISGAHLAMNGCSAFANDYHAFYCSSCNKILSTTQINFHTKCVNGNTYTSGSTCGCGTALTASNFYEHTYSTCKTCGSKIEGISVASATKGKYENIPSAKNYLMPSIADSDHFKMSVSSLKISGTTWRGEEINNKTIYTKAGGAAVSDLVAGIYFVVGLTIDCTISVPYYSNFSGYRLSYYTQMPSSQNDYENYLVADFVSVVNSYTTNNDNLSFTKEYSFSKDDKEFPLILSSHITLGNGLDSRLDEYMKQVYNGEDWRGNFSVFANTAPSNGFAFSTDTLTPFTFEKGIIDGSSHANANLNQLQNSLEIVWYKEKALSLELTNKDIGADGVEWAGTYYICILPKARENLNYTEKTLDGGDGSVYTFDKNLVYVTYQGGNTDNPPIKKENNFKNSDKDENSVSDIDKIDLYAQPFTVLRRTMYVDINNELGAKIANPSIEYSVSSDYVEVDNPQTNWEAQHENYYYLSEESDGSAEYVKVQRDDAYNAEYTYYQAVGYVSASSVFGDADAVTESDWANIMNCLPADYEKYYTVLNSGNMFFFLFSGSRFPKNDIGVYSYLELSVTFNSTDTYGDYFIKNYALELGAYEGGWTAYPVAPDVNDPVKDNGTTKYIGETVNGETVTYNYRFYGKFSVYLPPMQVVIDQSFPTTYNYGELFTYKSLDLSYFSLAGAGDLITGDPIYGDYYQFNDLWKIKIVNDADAAEKEYDSNMAFVVVRVFYEFKGESPTKDSSDRNTYYMSKGDFGINAYGEEAWINGKYYKEYNDTLFAECDSVPDGQYFISYSLVLVPAGNDYQPLKASWAEGVLAAWDPCQSYPADPFTVDDDEITRLSGSLMSFRMSDPLAILVNKVNVYFNLTEIAPEKNYDGTAKVFAPTYKKAKGGASLVGDIDYVFGASLTAPAYSTLVFYEYNMGKGYYYRTKDSVFDSDKDYYLVVETNDNTRSLVILPSIGNDITPITINVESERYNNIFEYDLAKYLKPIVSIEYTDSAVGNPKWIELKKGFTDTWGGYGDFYFENIVAGGSTEARFAMSSYIVETDLYINGEKNNITGVIYPRELSIAILNDPDKETDILSDDYTKGDYTRPYMSYTGIAIRVKKATDVDANTESPLSMLDVYIANHFAYSDSGLYFDADHQRIGEPFLTEEDLRGAKSYYADLYYVYFLDENGFRREMGYMFYSDLLYENYYELTSGQKTTFIYVDIVDGFLPGEGFDFKGALRGKAYDWVYPENFKNFLYDDSTGQFSKIIVDATSPDWVLWNDTLTGNKIDYYTEVNPMNNGEYILYYMDINTDYKVTNYTIKLNDKREGATLCLGAYIDFTFNKIFMDDKTYVIDGSTIRLNNVSVGTIDTTKKEFTIGDRLYYYETNAISDNIYTNKQEIAFQVSRAIADPSWVQLNLADNMSVGKYHTYTAQSHADDIFLADSNRSYISFTEHKEYNYFYNYNESTHTASGKYASGNFNEADSEGNRNIKILSFTYKNKYGENVVVTNNFDPAISNLIWAGTYLLAVTIPASPNYRAIKNIQVEFTIHEAGLYVYSSVASRKYMTEYDEEKEVSFDNATIVYLATVEEMEKYVGYLNTEDGTVYYRKSDVPIGVETYKVYIYHDTNGSDNSDEWTYDENRRCIFYVGFRYIDGDAANGYESFNPVTDVPLEIKNNFAETHYDIEKGVVSDKAGVFSAITQGDTSAYKQNYSIILCFDDDYYCKLFVWRQRLIIDIDPAQSKEYDGETDASPEYRVYNEDGEEIDVDITTLSKYVVGYYYIDDNGETILIVNDYHEEPLEQGSGIMVQVASPRNAEFAHIFGEETDNDAYYYYVGPSGEKVYVYIGLTAYIRNQTAQGEVLDNKMILLGSTVYCYDKDGYLYRYHGDFGDGTMVVDGVTYGYDADNGYFYVADDARGEIVGKTETQVGSFDREAFTMTVGGTTYYFFNEKTNAGTLDESKKEFVLQGTKYYYTNAGMIYTDPYCDILLSDSSFDIENALIRIGDKKYVVADSVLYSYDDRIYLKRGELDTALTAFDINGTVYYYDNDGKLYLDPAKENLVTGSIDLSEMVVMVGGKTYRAYTETNYRHDESIYHDSGSIDTSAKSFVLRNVLLYYSMGDIYSTPTYTYAFPDSTFNLSEGLFRFIGKDYSIHEPYLLKDGDVDIGTYSALEAIICLYNLTLYYNEEGKVYFDSGLTVCADGIRIDTDERTVSCYGTIYRYKEPTLISHDTTLYSLVGQIDFNVNKFTLNYYTYYFNDLGEIYSDMERKSLVSESSINFDAFEIVVSGTHYKYAGDTYGLFEGVGEMDEAAQTLLIDTAHYTYDGDTIYKTTGSFVLDENDYTFDEHYDIRNSSSVKVGTISLADSSFVIGSTSYYIDNLNRIFVITGTIDFETRTFAVGDSDYVYDGYRHIRIADESAAGRVDAEHETMIIDFIDYFISTDGSVYAKSGELSFVGRTFVLNDTTYYFDDNYIVYSNPGLTSVVGDCVLDMVNGTITLADVDYCFSVRRNYSYRMEKVGSVDTVNKYFVIDGRNYYYDSDFVYDDEGRTSIAAEVGIDVDNRRIVIGETTYRFLFNTVYYIAAKDYLSENIALTFENFTYNVNTGDMSNYNSIIDGKEIYLGINEKAVSQEKMQNVFYFNGKRGSYILKATATVSGEDAVNYRESEQVLITYTIDVMHICVSADDMYPVKEFNGKPYGNTETEQNITFNTYFRSTSYVDGADNPIDASWGDVEILNYYFYNGYKFDEIPSMSEFVFSDLKNGRDAAQGVRVVRSDWGNAISYRDGDIIDAGWYILLLKATVADGTAEKADMRGNIAFAVADGIPFTDTTYYESTERELYFVIFLARPRYGEYEFRLSADGLSENTDEAAQNAKEQLGLDSVYTKTYDNSKIDYGFTLNLNELGKASSLGEVVPVTADVSVSPEFGSYRQYLYTDRTLQPVSGELIGAIPGGAIYYTGNRYFHNPTTDETFDSGKIYYLHVRYMAEAFVTVGESTTNSLDETHQPIPYYEKSASNAYYRTLDSVFQSGKTYYLLSDAYVPTTIVGASATEAKYPNGSTIFYYQGSTDNKLKTSDTTFVSGKMYYAPTLSYLPVTVIAGQSTVDMLESKGNFYEYIDGYYRITEDANFVKGKTYYTLSGYYWPATVTSGESTAGIKDGNNQDIVYYEMNTYNATTDLAFAADKTYYTLTEAIIKYFDDFSMDMESCNIDENGFSFYIRYNINPKTNALAYDNNYASAFYIVGITIGKMDLFVELVSKTDEATEEPYESSKVFGAKNADVEYKFAFRFRPANVTDDNAPETQYDFDVASGVASVILVGSITEEIKASNLPVIDWSEVSLDDMQPAGIYSIRAMLGESTEQMGNYNFVFAGDLGFLIRKAKVTSFTITPEARYNGDIQEPEMIRLGIHGGNLDKDDGANPDWNDGADKLGNSVDEFGNLPYKIQCVGLISGDLQYKLNGSDAMNSVIGAAGILKENITYSNFGALPTDTEDAITPVPYGASSYGQYLFICSFKETTNYLGVEDTYFIFTITKKELKVYLWDAVGNVRSRGYADKTYDKRTDNYPAFAIRYDGFVGSDDKDSYRNTQYVQYKDETKTVEAGGISQIHLTNPMYIFVDADGNPLDYLPINVKTQTGGQYYHVKLFVDESNKNDFADNYFLTVEYMRDETDNSVLYPEMEIKPRPVRVIYNDDCKTIEKTYDGTKNVLDGTVKRDNYAFAGVANNVNSGLLDGDVIAIGVIYGKSAYARKDVFEAITDNYGIIIDYEKTRMDVRVFGSKALDGESKDNYRLQWDNVDEFGDGYVVLKGYINQATATVNFYTDSTKQSYVRSKLTVVYNGEEQKVYTDVLGVPYQGPNGETLYETIRYSERYYSEETTYDKPVPPKNCSTYIYELTILNETLEDKNYNTQTSKLNLVITQAEVKISFGGDSSQTYGDVVGLEVVATGAGDYMMNLTGSIEYFSRCHNVDETGSALPITYNSFYPEDKVDDIAQASAGVYYARVFYAQTTNFKAAYAYEEFAIVRREANYAYSISSEYTYTGSTPQMTFYLTFGNKQYTPVLLFDTVKDGIKTPYNYSYDENGDVTRITTKYPSDVGRYQVRPHSDNLENFIINNAVAVEFEIKKADLTVKVTNATIEANAAYSPEFTLKSSIFEKDITDKDQVKAIIGGHVNVRYYNAVTLAELATPPKQAGSYSVKAYGLELNNYNVYYQSGILTITTSEFSVNVDAGSSSNEKILIEGAFGIDTKITITKQQNSRFSDVSLAFDSFKEQHEEITGLYLTDIYVFDIKNFSYTSDNERGFTIRLLVPGFGSPKNVAYAAEENIKVAVFYSDGIEIVDATVDSEGYITFSTQYVNVKAISVLAETPQEDVTKKNLDWLMYLFIGLGVLMIGLSVLTVVLKKG